MRKRADTRSVDALCARIAGEQHGVLNDRQALACGMSRAGIHRRIASGRWVRVLPQVYRICGAPDTWEQRLMAACLWGGEGSAVSFGPAAALWGIEGFQRRGVEISTTANLKPRDRDLIVHRMDDNLLKHLSSVNGVPVTSIRRTLLDLAGARHRRAEIALDRALRKELTSLGAMWLFYEEEWTRGRRGIAILREFLIHRTPGLAPTDSDLELAMLKLIVDAGLPRPISQFPITIGDKTLHPDFCYPELFLAIECDSYAWHNDRQARDRDYERDNLLKTAGWTVLRFSWSQIHFEPDKVLGFLRFHIAPPTARVSPQSHIAALTGQSVR
jgi:hypothetical protein